MTASRVVITKVERFIYNAPANAYPLLRIVAENDGGAVALALHEMSMGSVVGGVAPVMLNTPKEVDALIEGLNALRAWQSEQAINDARRES